MHLTHRGQTLGNEWAGKQWGIDHPNFVMENGVLLFYVSRIADNAVDRYAYDLIAHTLTNTGTVDTG